jgi:tRNA A37 threonylcarbamoyladenosine biosynthesis protein TsaE
MNLSKQSQQSLVVIEWAQNRHIKVEDLTEENIRTALRENAEKERNESSKSTEDVDDQYSNHDDDYDPLTDPD